MLVRVLMEGNTEESVCRKQCANENDGNGYMAKTMYVAKYIRICEFIKPCTLYSRLKSPPSERRKKAFVLSNFRKQPPHITTHPLTPFTIYRLFSALFLSFLLDLPCSLLIFRFFFLPSPLPTALRTSTNDVVVLHDDRLLHPLRPCRKYNENRIIHFVSKS